MKEDAFSSFESSGRRTAGLLRFRRETRARDTVFLPVDGTIHIPRVLRPGGRIAFTVWASPGKCAGIDMVLKSMHGNADVELPDARPLFRFSDWRECERVLLGAGFAEPRVRDVDQTWHIRAPEKPFHALMRGGVTRSRNPQGANAGSVGFH